MKREQNSHTVRCRIRIGPIGVGQHHEPVVRLVPSESSYGSAALQSGSQEMLIGRDQPRAFDCRTERYAWYRASSDRRMFKVASWKRYAANVVLPTPKRSDPRATCFKDLSRFGCVHRD
jgi:hypothetical protein